MGTEILPYSYVYSYNVCYIHCHRVVKFQDGAQQYMIGVLKSCIQFVFFFHLADHLNFIYMSSRCSIYLANL